MSDKNSNLGLGIALGAVIGAAAACLFIKHKQTITEGFNRVTETIKENAFDLSAKAKEKVEDVKNKATDRIHGVAAKVEEKTRRD
jgi:gas vesicle protein